MKHVLVSTVAKYEIFSKAYIRHIIQMIKNKEDKHVNSKHNQVRM